MQTSEQSSAYSIIVALSIVLILSGCGAGPEDLTPPTPGNSGLIVLSDIQQTTVRLSWTAATDDKTASADLLYKVVRSLAGDIASAEHAEENGIVVMDWTLELTEVIDGSLLPTITTYYHNVIVKDEAENMAAYVMTTTNPIEGTPPVPGNSGIITTSDVTSTSLTLNWTEATDNISTQNNLQYIIFYSTLPNISTIEAADDSGTVAQNWTYDISSAPVTDLAPDTEYYFTVIVRDEALNPAQYPMISQSTLPPSSWILSEGRYFGPSRARQRSSVPAWMAPEWRH